MRNAFNRAADRVNVGLGSVWAMILSVLVVVVWAVTGPLFNFSDTWQLAINTGTTIVTLWMVFVIQNSQNRASKAVQLRRPFGHDDDPLHVSIRIGDGGPRRLCPHRE